MSKYPPPRVQPELLAERAGVDTWKYPTPRVSPVSALAGCVNAEDAETYPMFVTPFTSQMQMIQRSVVYTYI
eukprot:9797992-Karenia_brevis.AAC.1